MDRIQKVKPGDDLQAAIDRCPEHGIVELEAGDYSIPETLIINKQNITLKGAGKAATRIQPTYPGCHGIITLRHIDLKGNERVDLNGILDESVSQLQGLYVPNQRRITGFVGGGAAQRYHEYLKHDNWADVRKLTIEFAARFRNNHGDVARFFGFDRFETKPEPWMFLLGSHVGTYNFTYRRPDGTSNGLDIPCGNILEGVQRVLLQLDLDNGTAFAMVNGNIVKVKGVIPKGDQFIPNEFSDFGIWGGPHDFDILGLKWSPILVYDGEGKRLDNQENNDNLRYFYRENLAWSLTGERLSGRFVRASAGYSFESLFIIEQDHHSPWFGLGRITIQDLTLLGNTSGGQGLSIGNCTHFTLKNVAANSGWSYGLASTKMSVTYPFIIDDCDFDGNDRSAIFHGSIVYASNLSLGYGYRSFLFLNGSGGSFSNVFCSSPQGDVMEYYFVFYNSDDNGSCTFSNFGVDDEREECNKLKAAALINADRAGGYDMIYENIRLHLPNKDLPAFELLASEGGRPCRLMTQSVTIDQAKCVADIKSSRWAVGKVSDFDPGVPWS